MSYLIILFVIGFLILIHELGHFVSARLAGIPISRLSIGFGPKIRSWRRGETEYRLSAIPLGGYVIPAVEDETEFFSIPIRKRIFFALGGPGANLLLPLLLFALMNLIDSGFSFSGIFIEPFKQTAAYLVRISAALINLGFQPDQISGLVAI